MALSKTVAVHLFHVYNTLEFYVQNPNDLPCFNFYASSHKFHTAPLLFERK
jgi:hypothetical protein